jgi:hypothetical protein
MLALGTPGLAVQYFFRDTATGAVDASVPATATLDYTPQGENSLPTNPTPNAAISGIWQGRIETPEPLLQPVIEADAAARFH